MLLDSNAFLFWGLNLDTIRITAREALTAAPSLTLSMASVWEIEIKRGLGKLDVAIDWRSFVADKVSLLPIEIEDAELAGALPHHHRDPFDRMIIAQAKRRNLAIVTRDRAFDAYDVPVVWA